MKLNRFSVSIAIYARAKRALYVNCEVDIIEKLLLLCTACVQSYNVRFNIYFLLLFSCDIVVYRKKVKTYVHNTSSCYHTSACLHKHCGRQHTYTYINGNVDNVCEYANPQFLCRSYIIQSNYTRRFKGIEISLLIFSFVEFSICAVWGARVWWHVFIIDVMSRRWGFLYRPEYSFC